MSNWVKFSDRMPTEFDANFSKEVIAMSDNGTWHTVMLPHALHNPSWYEHHFWLENVPKPPRTLEDVVLEYLNIANWNEPWEQRYRDEMLEILEKGKDNG